MRLWAALLLLPAFAWSASFSTDSFDSNSFDVDSFDLQASDFACSVDDSSPFPGVSLGITCSGGTGGNIVSLASPDGTVKNVAGGASATTASWTNWALSDFVSGGAAQNVEWAVSGTWVVTNGTENANVTMQIDPPDTDGPDDWFFTLTTPAGSSVCPVAAAAGDEAFVEREAGTSMVVLDNCAVSADTDWEVNARIWDESANSGNGQWSAVLNTVLDSTPPSGYTVSIDQAGIDNDNDDALSFTFAAAEVGATYDYSISSSGGGTPVTDTGTISTATDQITGIDVTALPDGTLTLAVTLTDPVGNEGEETTDTVEKDTTSVPSGYTVAITGASYNASTCGIFEFAWSGAEIGATYGCAVTSSGGAGSVAINGTISSADQESGTHNVCGLPDGTLTLTCALTNGQGTGSDATDTATLDDTLPTLSSATVASNGNSITLAFNEAVTGQGGWSLSASGGAVTPTYSSGDTTNSHVYTLSRTISSHETVTVSYAPGTLVDGVGNALASISGAAVTNNSTVDTIAPTFDSAAVPSAGTTIVVDFDEAVSEGASYDNGDWTITASGGAATVTGASGDGTAQWTLTTSRIIEIGETVTLGWSGTANGIEDAAGNDLAAFSEAVTNNSTEAIPTIVSSTIAADGDSISDEYSEVVNVGAGGNGGFALTCSGGAVTTTYSSGDASDTLVHSTSRTIGSHETCTRAYTQPGNGIEDDSGIDVASFSGFAVTNGSTVDAVAPTIQSARISGAVLTWNLSETMFAGAGGTGGATLTCSGGAVTPTYDAISGSQITFDLSREPANDETCTTGYTQPGNGFEDGAGNDLATFSGQAVTFPSTDNCPRVIRGPLKAPIKTPVRLPICAS